MKKSAVLTFKKLNSIQQLHGNISILAPILIMRFEKPKYHKKV